jgi:hypothetical protein
MYSSRGNRAPATTIAKTTNTVDVPSDNVQRRPLRQITTAAMYVAFMVITVDLQTSATTSPR